MPAAPAERQTQPRTYENILQTIGKTPLVQLNRVVAGASLCTVFAKLESFNPGGSVKDRIALSIIEDAEQHGLLKAGGTIVEATSGNTGAGLALAAAVKGYKCVFVMPDKMSEEKVRYLRAFGARVIITPTAVTPDDPRSYYSVARRIVSETPNSILANQYYNPANPAAHYRTTGPEIWEQTTGRIDAWIAGMGTGGTITGVGEVLKDRNPGIWIAAVEPAASPVLSGGTPGPHKIAGIGAGFVPVVLNTKIYNEVITVADADAAETAQALAKKEGILPGISSGAAMWAAIKVARRLGKGKKVVVILPDRGERYLSTGLFVSESP